MSKVELRLLPFIYPIPTVLLGANVNGKPNYNVVGNCGIIKVSNPAVIYVSSNVTHYTNTGIRECGSFSVNFPSSDMAEITDYCGIVSGKKVDKSNVFRSFYGKLKNVPMIEECPINLECKVIQTVIIHDMEVYMGEVVGAYANEQCLTNGSPDMKKVDPLVYSLQNSYWKMGDEIAPAFSIGKGFKPDEK